MGLARRSVAAKLALALTLALMLVVVGCARCADDPGVRVQLACKTSRFGWVPTSAGAAAPRPETTGDHHHGSGELILPLVLGRSRCPVRGQVLVRVTSPRAHAPLDVEVRGLDRVVRERVASGPGVALTASWALGALEPGRYPLSVRVDGRDVVVPPIEVVR